MFSLPIRPLTLYFLFELWFTYLSAFFYRKTTHLLSRAIDDRVEGVWLKDRIGRPSKECPRSDEQGEQNQEREGQRMSNGRDIAIQNAPVIGHCWAQTTFHVHTSRQSAQKILTRGSCTTVYSALRKSRLLDVQNMHLKAATSAGWEWLLGSLSSIEPRARRLDSKC